MNKINFHKQTLVARFSKSANGYEQHARLQELVADRLASMLPELEHPDILEIGCGTGFLTRHLLATYEGARFEITDLSRAMLDECAKNIPVRDNLYFSVMDGEQPDLTRHYDLIVTSMTAQWFDEPDKSLLQLQSLLKPQGQLLYSTVGPNLFPQWRSVLQELGLPCGLVDVPKLPGLIDEDTHQMGFASGVQFLQNLKYTGASMPRSDYRGLTASELRRAIHLFETKMHCRADWHILYGRLRA